MKDVKWVKGRLSLKFTYLYLVFKGYSSLSIEHATMDNVSIQHLFAIIIEIVSILVMNFAIQTLLLINILKKVIGPKKILSFSFSLKTFSITKRLQRK